MDQNSFIKEGGRVELSVLWNKFGICSGTGSYALTTNQVKGGETILLKNQYIFVPFGVSYIIPLLIKDENTALGFQIKLGGYAGNLNKTRITTRDEEVSKTNLGWNFGIDGDLKLLYNLYKNFDIKTGFQTMTDISKIEDQKITQGHSYSLGIGYRF